MKNLDQIQIILTPREQEILAELILGKKDQEIANSLEISINTVKTHLKRIYLKLDVTGRVETILYMNK